MEGSQNTKHKEVVVNRIIDAPVDVVWKAWTVPEHIMKWWGPQDYTSPLCEVDLHEGGTYIFSMRAPKNQGGQDSYTTGTYTKVIPGELLEFTQSLSDKEGNLIEPESIGMPADFPERIRTTIEFKMIKHDMTELIITEYGWTPGQMYIFSLAGMQQSIDKLAASLK